MGDRPKWAFISMSCVIHVERGDVSELIDELYSFPESSTYVLKEDAGFNLTDELLIEWNVPMSDSEYEDELSKRERLRGKREERKRRKDAEYKEQIRTEAMKLGLLKGETP